MTNKSEAQAFSNLLDFCRQNNMQFMIAYSSDGFCIDMNKENDHEACWHSENHEEEKTFPEMVGEVIEGAKHE